MAIYQYMTAEITLERLANHDGLLSPVTYDQKSKASFIRSIKTKFSWSVFDTLVVSEEFVWEIGDFSWKAKE